MEVTVTADATVVTLSYGEFFSPVCAATATDQDSPMYSAAEAVTTADAAADATTVAFG